MPIVDPGPFWNVDLALDRAMTEFSHGLAAKQPVLER